MPYRLIQSSPWQPPRIINFKSVLSKEPDTAPLKRNVAIDEFGNVAAFMRSDLASGVAGKITYIDCGYNIAGLAAGYKALTCLNSKEVAVFMNVFLTTHT